MEEIEKKAEELLSSIELSSHVLESEDAVEITEEMEELMEKIEKKDGRYSLALEDPDLYLKLSLICYLNDRFDDAQRWVKKSLRSKNSYLGFLIKGKILEMKNDPKGALGEYHEALKYDEEPLVHIYRYQVLKERGKFERALAALDEALKEKESGEIFAKKADLLMDIGNVEKAKKFYKAAEKSDPDLQNKEKKIEELLDEAEKKVQPEMYDDILELDDKNTEAWLGKARCYWDLNQEEKAIDTLEKAIEYADDERIVERLEDYKEEDSSMVCSNCGGDGECPDCDGSGYCQRCEGSGDCLECDGTTECSDCEGTGECPNCEGEGKVKLFFTCKVCSGTGHCQTCEGYGTCPACDATGDCQLCGGNKNCKECQGSGVCPVCGGTGKEPE
ncbi:MAG: tetratricopeptide repeat protein [Candidatus Aenigmatarchaeota archaeon]